MTEQPSLQPQGAEEVPKESVKKSDNWEAIKKSAKWREGVSRRYIQSLENITMEQFMASLSEPPFNLTNINSVTEGVYKLQKYFGFKDEATPTGCDGILGKRTYARRQIALKAHRDRSELQGKIPSTKPYQQTNRQSYIHPNPNIIEQMPNNSQQLVESCNLSKKYKPNELSICGDSLQIYNSYRLARMCNKNSKHFIKNDFVEGGRRTIQYDNRPWDSNEKRAKEALDQPNCKCLIYNGGFNDLGSCVRWACKGSPKTQKAALDKVVKQIVASHKRVIKKAHSLGKAIIMFKIHPIRKKEFKGWLKNPVAQKMMAEGTRRVNEGIMQLKPDMIIDPGKLPPTAFGKIDPIHWNYRVGSKLIMEAITNNAIA